MVMFGGRVCGSFRRQLSFRMLLGCRGEGRDEVCCCFGSKLVVEERRFIYGQNSILVFDRVD